MPGMMGMGCGMGSSKIVDPNFPPPPPPGMEDWFWKHPHETPGALIPGQGGLMEQVIDHISVKHAGCPVVSQKYMRGNLVVGDRAHQTGRNAEGETDDGYLAHCFPQPVFPAPNTAQYGMPGRRRYNALSLPKHTATHESDVYANIVNKADILEKSLADRYLVKRSREYFARIDGWILEFWNKAEFNPAAAKKELIFPDGYIDLRTVRGVEYEKMVSLELSSASSGISFSPMYPWEVMLNTKEGLFFFRVHDEFDAFKWQETIKIAVVDNLKALEKSRAQAKERVKTESGVREETRAGPKGSSMARSSYDELMHYTLDPTRERQLRTLWKSAVRSTVKGEMLEPTTFSAIFELYDLDGNQNLDPEEVEIMLKELYTVRWEELHQALEQQQRTIFSPEKMLLNAAEAQKEWQKTVGNLGTKLKERYAYLLQRHGFASRATAMRVDLDTSHDGTVNLSEFVRGAPKFLLPTDELQMEGQFYLNCAQAIVRIEKQHEDLERLCRDDDSEDSEDEGCIQQ
jgi:hypothetical protein